MSHESLELYNAAKLSATLLAIELSLEKELIDNARANKKSKDHGSHCCSLLKTSSIKLTKSLVPSVTRIM